MAMRRTVWFAACITGATSLPARCSERPSAWRCFTMRSSGSNSTRPNRNSRPHIWCSKAWLSHRLAADAHIGKAGFRHLCRTIDVPQIDHEGPLEERLDAVEIERAKFVPLRQDHDAIGAGERFIGILASLDLEHLLGFVSALGII